MIAARMFRKVGHDFLHFYLELYLPYRNQTGQSVRVALLKEQIAN